MARGYSSRLLHVDLSRNEVKSQVLGEEIVSKYIGGSGIAAKIVWDETDANTDPLSPQSPLIFMTGPLTGTQVPSSGRYTVAALSPLTNIWGEAHSGGSWADELKHTVFDGVIIRGKASHPVYLWINEDKAEIRDASHLWGKETFETNDLVRDETDLKASVAVIGPAGENLVKFACIMNDGKDGRAAARCGLGAVMGSKNLKAVAVRGTKRRRLHDAPGLSQSVDKRYYSIIEYEPELYKTRARKMFEGFWNAGRPPIQNWRLGVYPGSIKPFLDDVENGERYFCRRCRTGCGESFMLPHGRRPVHEALGPLGSQCLIDDIPAIDEAYQVCNRLGMDSISTGATIAFAMELFEKGLISTDSTRGVKLSWGNSEAMIKMVWDIGLRNGFGAVLGEGVRHVAQKIGGLALECSLHVKGLEVPAHDPRAGNTRALGYATVNLGADHGPTLSSVADRPFPELGLYDAKGVETRFSTEGVEERVAKVQNFGALINSLVVCRLAVLYWMPKGTALQPSAYLDWLNLVTGWNMTLEEFMRCGERIFNLQRMINVRRGISRKDDMLPLRFLTDRLEEGGTQGNLPPLTKMLGNYYKYRGWSDDGIPPENTLI